MLQRATYVNDSYTTVTVNIYHNSGIRNCRLHNESKPNCETKIGVLEDHQSGLHLNFQR